MTSTRRLLLVRGVTIAVVAVLAGLAPTLAGFLPASAGALVLLLTIGAATRKWRSAELTDAILLVAMLWLLLTIPFFLAWPIPGIVALAIAALVAWRRKRWWAWRTWLRVGTIDRTSWALVALVAVLTVIGLILWRYLSNGQLPGQYRALIHSVPPWVAVAAGFAFLAINGAIEDSIWSGVLLNATEKFMPVGIALIVTAFSFGLAHLGGVPSGLIGAVMAGAWGVVLGALRLRTKGMAATYIAHVIADTTIIVMLLPNAL